MYYCQPYRTQTFEEQVWHWLTLSPKSSVFKNRFCFPPIVGISLYGWTRLQFFLALRLRVNKMSLPSSNEDEEREVRSDEGKEHSEGVLKEEAQEENKEDSEDEDSVEKVKELDEIAKIFKYVPKEKRQYFLYGMRTDGYDGTALEQKSFYKPAPPDYDNEYEHNVKEEAANCNYQADYAAYAKKQQDAANEKTSAKLNSRISTAQKLQSGFQIACASCSANNIDEVKVVL